MKPDQLRMQGGKQSGRCNARVIGCNSFRTPEKPSQKFTSRRKARTRTRDSSF